MGRAAQDLPLKVVGVIPARYASTRLHGKMLLDVAGKPLVVRTLEAARSAKMLDRLLVATDDPRIQKAVEAEGGEAVLTAPELPSGSDRVLAALSNVEADVVVNIQGDEPLLPGEVIDQCVNLLLHRPDFGVTTAASPLKPDDLHNPNVVKVVISNDHKALYFSRAPIPFPRTKKLMTRLYRRHIGLYVFRRKVLEYYCGWPESELEKCESLEQLRLLAHGVDIGLVDVPEIPPGVDTEEDLNRVREQYESSGSSPLVACIIPVEPADPE